MSRYVVHRNGRHELAELDNNVEDLMQESLHEVLMGSRNPQFCRAVLGKPFLAFSFGLSWATAR
jgi:hypothetical protein